MKANTEYIKSVKKSGLLSGGGLGFTIGKEKKKDQYVNQNTEQVGRTVGSVKGSVDLEAQKDTNIKGGKLSGEKVTGNVGNDLNIESKQDSNSYKENNKSIGASVGLGSNKAVSGSASVGKIDSKYESVTDQSGIYAGKNGFDIRVEDNTDVNGGIISSTADADKNKLSTGTLTFEDIQNKADYKAGGAGIKVDTSAGAEKKDTGVTPNIGVGARDDAESTTTFFCHRT